MMSEPLHTIQTVDARDDNVLRVVQLTDTHLFAEPGGTLLGMDTDHSLQAVIDLVRKEQSVLDLLLGTGDLADGGCMSAYDRLQAYFDQLDTAHYWLPGNHDNRANMAAAANQPLRLCKEVRSSAWQIVLLDSQIPGAVGGSLGAQELALLQRALASAQEQNLYSLVCLHHQPVAIGCAWLDQQMVADADDFFAVLDQFSGVRGVLWGHVHQEIDRQRNGVRLLASPSTCVQFAAGSMDFKADDQPPGYRWLELYPDGEIVTAVSRDQNHQFTVQLDSGGYL